MEILMQTAQILFGEVSAHFKGYGSGYGSGYGDGSGDGYGDGSGDGYGYGYGYGYGDGDGYGDGSGDGYGSGSGDGYGSGSGSKEYWAKMVDTFAGGWSQSQTERLSALRADGCTIAYWRSDANARPCNGGRGEAVRPGLIQTIKGPLCLCGDRALHATAIPPAWKGDRLWIVALKGEVQWQDDKCGALCREIIGEVL